MAESFDDLTLEDEWQDVAASEIYPEVAGQRVTIQYKGGPIVLVYIGGASAPSNRSFGILLEQGQSVTGTSDHFWVRGAGTVAILVED